MRLPMVSFALAIAACRASPAPPPAAPEPPPRPTRAHVVQPIELVLRGRPASGARLAILATHGEAWLRLDGEARSSPGWLDVDGAELAVAEERGDRVRILHEDHDVRLLIWVARADLARVLVRDVELRPGVRLHAGLPIAGPTAATTIRGDGLELTGHVDPEAIGEIWEAAPPRTVGETITLGHGVPIRATADRGGEILAVTTESIEVRVLGAAASGWREIETTGPRITVRGFVDEWIGGGLETFSTGGGGGFAVTHAISLELPAGTCLYDAIDGQMIGVITATGSRLGSRTDDGAWYHTFVNSPWGLLDIAIHDGGSGWDRCADL